MLALLKAMLRGNYPEHRKLALCASAARGPRVRQWGCVCGSMGRHLRWCISAVNRSKSKGSDTIIDTSSEISFEILESPEGGYEARALGFPIFTQADSEEELKVMVQEAVHCHFESEADRPHVIRLHWVTDELISV